VATDPWVIPMVLRVPSLTDIRSDLQSGNGDLVEVPAGSGRFYHCIQVDDFGKGFGNEHRWAFIVAITPPSAQAWPEPYP
jgi:hypothetical protein